MLWVSLCVREISSTLSRCHLFTYSPSLFFQCMIIVCCCCHSALLHWSSADVSLECYSHNPSLFNGTLQYHYWLHNRASASYAIFTDNDEYNFTVYKTRKLIDRNYILSLHATIHETTQNDHKNATKYKKKSAEEEEKKHNKSYRFFQWCPHSALTKQFKTGWFKIIVICSLLHPSYSNMLHLRLDSVRKEFFRNFQESVHFFFQVVSKFNIDG